MGHPVLALHQLWHRASFDPTHNQLGGVSTAVATCHAYCCHREVMKTWKQAGPLPFQYSLRLHSVLSCTETKGVKILTDDGQQCTGQNYYDLSLCPLVSALCVFGGFC